MRPRVMVVLGVVTFVVLLGGVALFLSTRDDGGGGGSGGGSGSDAGDSVVNVVTAAPLEPVVSDVVAAFAEEEPDVDVQVDTVPDKAGMRDALGGRADVAISPRPWAGGKKNAKEFGRNLVAMAVPEGNPEGISIGSFAATNPANVLTCSKPTYLGDFVLFVLSRAAVEPDPAEVQEGCEQDALRRVASGELDAALLYRAGYRLPEGVELVPLPQEYNLVIAIVTVRQGSSDETQTFMRFVRSKQARSIIERANYLP
jgi:molybdate transport system substrate-binding protein